MANERPGAVTMRGNPLTLVGPELGTGDTAPEVTLLDSALRDTTVGGAGKVRIVSVVPSLDTPVCDLQTKRFNEEAGSLGDDIEVLSVSADLPFAQARWCTANAASAITTLSDHRSMAFGEAFGTLVKELRLDARAIFVIDRAGKLAHVEYVGEIAEHPDYDAAVSAAKQAAS
ncbi:MAG: thiol peroxidase [Myxococcota bacterium]|nr:thiol peroxidase [Myxococcota bacterium]